MSRGLPFSLLFHTVMFVLVVVFGTRVARAPVQPPRSIRVKMVQLPRPLDTARPQETPPEAAPVVVKETVPDLPPKQIPEKKPETKPETKPQEKQPERREDPPEPAADQTEAADDPAPQPVLATGPSVQGTDSDFPFAWYLSRVEGLIARNWNPRQLGFGKRAVVSCAVHFSIARGGAVSQTTLVASSGIGVFDRESLRAVQTTSLPPLPPQYGSSSLGVTFIFNLEPGS